MNMRIVKAAVMSILLLAVAPVMNVQGAESLKEEASPFPKNGVRFVICSSGDMQLPSPMYVKVGKDYLPVIVSRRMPSPRLAPEGGVVKFYKDKPETVKDAKEPKEAPVLTIAVPQAYCGPTTKALCMVQPVGKGDQMRTYFMKESDFKLGGVHVINLTSKKLEIIYDETGNFDGQEKRVSIQPKQSSANVQDITSKDRNVWQYSAKAPRVNFVLQAAPETRGAEPTRIRSSVFMPNADLSQISIVVESTKRKNVFELHSVQFSKDYLSEAGSGSKKTR